MDINPKEIYDKIPQVLYYKKILEDLGQNWNTLNLLNQVNDSGESMEKTQSEFNLLSEDLLLHLAKESLKQLSNEIDSKSQVVIDILIRNLFERTADIGFLATDDAVRDFIEKYTSYHQELSSYKKFDKKHDSCQRCPEPFKDQCNSNTNTPILNSLKDILCASNHPKRQQVLKEEFSTLQNSIKGRFKEYIEKYSVYFDVIVTDTAGNILVTLDDAPNIAKSNDAIIIESLKTKNEFVEYYGISDFSKNKEPLLLYGFKIFKTNEKVGEPIGVLILCFKFEDEMDGIFSFLNNGAQNFTIGILDKTNTLISSSNKFHFPIGTKIKSTGNKDVDLIEFGGKKYLIKISPTRGYQGFYGLGWRGCCFVSIEDGFYDDQSNILSSIDSTILDAVMSSPSLFSKKLQEIPHKAKKIQDDLSRTVWNGSLKQQTAIAKKLLAQVASTGQKTNLVFNDSINSLHETVLKTMLSVVTFQASLGIDIMDRNLYERANDCRWWALSDKFKIILDKEMLANEDKQTLHHILHYINELYTVYINIFLYDRTGNIVAVSNKDFNEFIGLKLNNDTVRNTLQNRDSQKYFVTNFDATNLYNNEHTYIYHASITNLSHDKTVGGIGIVFDASPQFKAILEDILPSSSSKNYFAVFADNSGKVISSSNEQIAIDSYLDIPNTFFNLSKGQSYSSIVQFNDCYYAVGSQASKGYREYKNLDGYNNEVVAISFSLLSCTQESSKKEQKKNHFSIATYPKDTNPTREIGTFFLGNYWYGFETKDLVGATGIEEIQRDTNSNIFVGRIFYENQFVEIINLHSFLHINPSENQQIIVFKDKNVKLIGLIIDFLGPICEIPQEMIGDPKGIFTNKENFIELIAKPPEGINKILSILNPNILIETLIKEVINDES